MSFIDKLTKWIELEIEELEKLENDLNSQGDNDRANDCVLRRVALEEVSYILYNKGVWHTNKGHGIFDWEIRREVMGNGSK